MRSRRLIVARAPRSQAGSGVGVATSFLLPWSLLPDTVDDAERETGERSLSQDDTVILIENESNGSKITV